MRRAGSTIDARATASPRLPGFEHINRYWDRTRASAAAKLEPGDYYVTRCAELITTVLGSCVSACVRDRVHRVGGMNHFMLPDSVAGDCAAWASTRVNAATRYGTFAMEHLINDILSHGGRRENLEVKLFGGARVLSATTEVGRRNVGFVLDFARTEGLEVVARDLGGAYPRKLLYEPASGRAWVKRLRCLHNDTIVRRERDYLRELRARPLTGEVDLF